MSFNDFIHENGLNNKTTSIIKIYQILPSLSLIDVGIHLRDGPFWNFDKGIVNLHPSKGSHWVC